MITASHVCGNIISQWKIPLVSSQGNFSPSWQRKNKHILKPTQTKQADTYKKGENWRSIVSFDTIYLYIQ